MFLYGLHLIMQILRHFDRLFKDRFDLGYRGHGKWLLESCLYLVIRVLCKVTLLVITWLIGN